MPGAVSANGKKRKKQREIGLLDIDSHDDVDR